MTARDRRTAIAGIVIVGALVAIARGLPALIEWQRRSVLQAGEATSQASSAKAGVRLLPSLRDSLRARRQRLMAIDSALLSGASAPAATARLAATLDEIAGDARLKVTTMQLRADSAARGALTQVAVRVTGVADVVGLAAFLRAVDGDESPLIVRELGVTQSEPAAAADKVEALRVDILVVGLARITATHP